jgi:hypothetical protein
LSSSSGLRQHRASSSIIQPYTALDVPISRLA